MITAQQAKEIATPLREEKIKEVLAWVYRDIEKAARIGETSLKLHCKLEWDVVFELVNNQNFKVVSRWEGDNEITVISWY